MEALLWEGPRAMRAVQLARPAPGPGEVLIQVEAVGICGSELEGYLGAGGLRRPPLLMGHEFGGLVAELGPGVDSPAVATRVAVNPIVPCGACPTCIEGMTNVCPHRHLIGVTRPGAFAQWVAVPARACIPVPALTSIQAALVEPLATCVHAAALGQIGLGDRVAILGAGTIGLLLLRVARAAGAGEIAVVDTLPARLEVAQELGATITVNAAGADAVAELAGHWGPRGADVAFDAVGRTVTRAQAAALVRPGHRVVLAGLHDPESSLPANELVRNEICLIGSYTYTPVDFRRAIRLLEQGAAGPGRWTDVRPLAAGPAAFRELTAAPGAIIKVILAP